MDLALGMSKSHFKKKKHRGNVQMSESRSKMGSYLQLCTLFWPTVSSFCDSKMVEWPVLKTAGT